METKASCFAGQMPKSPARACENLRKFASKFENQATACDEASQNAEQLRVQCMTTGGPVRTAKLAGLSSNFFAIALTKYRPFRSARAPACAIRPFGKLSIGMSYPSSSAPSHAECSLLRHVIGMIVGEGRSACLPSQCLLIQRPMSRPCSGTPCVSLSAGPDKCRQNEEEHDKMKSC